jgi:Co/Zn/Cd efflux system component
MTNKEFQSLINKYAILLFIGYFLSFILSTVIVRFVSTEYLQYPNLIEYLSSASGIIQLIVNIIAAVLISKDMKKLQIKNSLIVIMTVLFSLIGITMFFISANKEIKITSNS